MKCLNFNLVLKKQCSFLHTKLIIVSLQVICPHYKKNILEKILQKQIFQNAGIPSHKRLTTSPQTMALTLRSQKQFQPIHEQRTSNLMNDNSKKSRPPPCMRPRFDENNTPLKFHSLATLDIGEVIGSCKTQPYSFERIIITLA